MQISSDEINRLLALNPQSRTTGVKGGSTANAGEASRSPDAAADIAMSETSQDVQFVKRALSRVPEVREDRVSALKAAIENGTYKVSGDDIADLIIRRALADNAAL